MNEFHGPEHTDLTEVLRKHWGYTQFRAGQEATIRSVLDGRDILFLLLFCHFFILLLFRLQISAFISMIVNMMQQKKTENR